MNPPVDASPSPNPDPEPPPAEPGILEALLGPSALRRGQIIEIGGPPASGKTSLSLHLVAQAQAQGELCAWIDGEQAFEAHYAQRCGLCLENLVLAQPDNLEQALDILDTLARSGAINLIIVDGLQSLPAQAQLLARLNVADEAEEIAQNNRLLSQALRRLTIPLRQHQPTLIFTTQEEQKGMAASYHALANNTARLTLKLRAGLRLKLSPRGLLRQNGRISGWRMRVDCIKNQITPCHQSIELDIMYDGSILRIW
jgi:recombination protein RecA